MSEHIPDQMCRAVIRDGRVTITRRPFHLMAKINLAYTEALREAGTTVCDLELDGEQIGERELTVSFVPPGSETESAVDALLAWAAVAGCRRVWLPKQVVELQSELVPHPDDLEPCECPTCGVIPIDMASADDVARSRIRGLRPRICPVCSSRVPERRHVGAADGL